ncbi:hypothetical protein TNCV_3190221 [Trichonephila clavipes]|nr:hypothetical protein TNCV_3190221 [Trichonephila clavipes]
MRPSWSHKLKRDSSEKTKLSANKLARLCAHEPIADAAVDDLPTSVAVDQHAANCRRKLYGHSPPYGEDVDCRALMSPSIVHCQSSSCSVFVGPQLPNLHRCGTVPLHTSSCCTLGQSSISKADNLPPFELREMASRLSPTYEFSFPLAAEFARARAPKFSPMCASEWRSRI